MTAPIPPARRFQLRKRSRETRLQVRRCQSCGRRVPSSRPARPPVCCDTPDLVTEPAPDAD